MAFLNSHKKVNKMSVILLIDVKQVLLNALAVSEHVRWLCQTEHCDHAVLLDDSDLRIN